MHQYKFHCITAFPECLSVFTPCVNCSGNVATLNSEEPLCRLSASCLHATIGAGPLSAGSTQLCCLGPCNWRKGQCELTATWPEVTQIHVFPFFCGLDKPKKILLASLKCLCAELYCEGCAMRTDVVQFLCFLVRAKQGVPDRDSLKSESDIKDKHWKLVVGEMKAKAKGENANRRHHRH